MKKLLLATTLIAGSLTFPPVRAELCSFCDTSDFDTLLKDNSNVVVDFYASWCGPCKRLTPIIEALSNEMSNVLFIKVNYDSFASLARSKGVSSFPTIIAFKNGKQVATSIGYKSKTALKSWINSTLGL